MTQLNLFSNTVNLIGLSHQKDFITADQELNLIQIIDRMRWIEELKRRVQHYGYRYNYKNRSINHSDYLGRIPDWLQEICKKLYTEKIFDKIPDQVIINEYLPGQGTGQITVTS